jgi:peptidoglycan/LPS O-acetylase OafA/YrhL
MGLIRLLLAVAVVCEHARLPYTLVGGQVAVQLFYLISGFVISYVLTARAAYRDVGVFYRTRLLRIFPAYLLVAAAMLVLRLVEGERIAEFMTLPAPAQAVLIVSNLLIVGQDWIMFLAPSGNGLAFTANFHDSSPQLWTFLLLPQGWTLAMELCFYALAPFILPRRRLLWALFLGSLAARVAAYWAGLNYDPWLARFFPFELAIFAAGALSHQLLLPIARQAPNGRTALALAIALLAVQPLLRLPAPLLIGLFALLLPFLFLVTAKADRWLGDLSYPVFLVHWPVWLVCLRLGEAQGVPPLLTGVTTLILSLAAAQLILFALAPLERIRRRLGTRPAGAPAKAGGP